MRISHGQLTIGIVLLTLNAAPMVIANDADAANTNKKDKSVTAEKVPLLPNWLQLTGEVRGRFEAPSGSSVLNATGDAYYLSRLRFGVGLKPLSWLRLYTEVQDGRTAGYSYT